MTTSKMFEPRYYGVYEPVAVQTEEARVTNPTEAEARTTERAEAMTSPTFAELEQVTRWVSGHPAKSVCPRCGQDVSRDAVVGLAYVFTSCGCEEWKYSHLYEQVWHLECLSVEAPVLAGRRFMERVLSMLHGYKRGRLYADSIERWLAAIEARRALAAVGGRWRVKPEPTGDALSEAVRADERSKVSTASESAEERAREKRLRDALLTLTCLVEDSRERVIAQYHYDAAVRAARSALSEQEAPEEPNA